jgi:hypothetical protein
MQHPVRGAIMQNIAAVAQRLIARAPRWLKQDLLKDGREREQAEDMLAALIKRRCGIRTRRNTMPRRRCDHLHSTVLSRASQRMAT